MWASLGAEQASIMGGYRRWSMGEGGDILMRRPHWIGSPWFNEFSQSKDECAGKIEAPGFRKRHLVIALRWGREAERERTRRFPTLAPPTPTPPQPKA